MDEYNKYNENFYLPKSHHVKLMLRSYEGLDVLMLLDNQVLEQMYQWNYKRFIGKKLFIL